MPRETSRVSLDHDVNDPCGLPVTNIHFDGHPNGIAMHYNAQTQSQAIREAVAAGHSPG